ncbi:conserved hypothetical protein [Talaromyces stipitatus ATCC 10500]|uniref:Myb-like domain-containing protein n=1 Tax=Talaromyces stipitatus (strain ATCC 10500 / CBS 375.48 / QM 6759 / NRRL 1006) TaxID=441959 RepID=B8M616_TALSN|nr:uncharacterized protein TSTA_023510 [Talaromyces stipitatus ATCC 10500]EED19016.1 conserved hypothetical protein [Talaromyces stipitatus ATCC 10500]
MDHIIFEDPSQRVSRAKKVCSNPSVPLARRDGAIEQAPGQIDPHFSHTGIFDIQFNGNEPVSLYDMFSLCGDDESGNEDQSNGSSKAPSLQPNTQQERSTPVPHKPEDDIIPIDPAILEGEKMNEDKPSENDAPDCSGSPAYPISPKSLTLHGHAQNIEGLGHASASFNVLQTAAEAPQFSSKRPSSNAIDAEPPCKQSRSDALAAKNYQSTLYSCFSAASLHERLEFFSWLFQYGLSESLSAASAELPFTQAKTADKSPESLCLQRRRLPPTPNRRRATSIRSRKGKAWEPDEIELLIKLKEDGLSWSVITKRFQKRFPGRSRGSIQVYWSTNLKYLHSL